MKKINRRTKVLILTVIMAIVFVAIYLFGIFIPEEAVAGSFLNAKKAIKGGKYFISINKPIPLEDAS